MTIMGVTDNMNEPEKETIKQTIKELMDIINRCEFPDGNSELETRLKEITHNLIDLL